jgi:hypothetical protein
MSNVEMTGQVEWSNLQAGHNSEFVCAADSNRDAIAAGVESGELEPWRIDAQGNQWFRRRERMIGPPAGWKDGVGAGMIRGANLP